MVIATLFASSSPMSLVLKVAAVEAGVVGTTYVAALVIVQFSAATRAARVVVDCSVRCWSALSTAATECCCMLPLPQ